MVVTEKCDVYSFGVLTLQVLMGKHPGELVSCLQSDQDSDESNINIESYNDLLDSRLSAPTSQNVADELGLVVNVALSCIRVKPQSRPSMENVSKLLHNGSSS